MLLITDGCLSYNHPEIELYFDESQTWGLDASFLKVFLQERVSKGAKYLADDTIDIGWMRLKFADLENENLILREPDLINFPIEWISSVTSTIRFLHLSKWVAESVGLESKLSFANYMQMAVVSDRDPDEPLVMQRKESTPNSQDSGWVIGGESHFKQDQSVRRRPMSLYEVGYNQHDLIPFFCLPVGTEIHFTPSEKIKVSYQGEPTEFASGSYLEKMLKKENPSETGQSKTEDESKE